jgi:hypothetical protein
MCGAITTTTILLHICDLVLKLTARLLTRPRSATVLTSSVGNFALTLRRNLPAAVYSMLEIGVNLSLRVPERLLASELCFSHSFSDISAGGAPAWQRRVLANSSVPRRGPAFPAR